MPPPRTNFQKQLLGISEPTIVDYGMFIREIFIHYCVKFLKLKIGGPGKIVEIDERAPEVQ